jgi:hypothetical protein
MPQVFATSRLVFVGFSFFAIGQRQALVHWKLSLTGP